MVTGADCFWCAFCRSLGSGTSSSRPGAVPEEKLADLIEHPRFDLKRELKRGLRGRDRDAQSCRWMCLTSPCLDHPTAAPLIA